MRTPSLLAVAACVAALSSCSASSSVSSTSGPPTTTQPTSTIESNTTVASTTASVDPSSSSASSSSSSASSSTTAAPAAGGIYAHTLSVGDLSPAVKDAKNLVYVPNSESNSVDVIDPATYAVVDHFVVGNLPQHIVPAWNLKTLYVNIDKGNQLVPIDPNTGLPGKAFTVEDPYNLYFTPDGQYAIVVAEARSRLDFYEPTTWKRQFSIAIPHKGVNHIDFSADGTTFLASCEFSGWIVRGSIPDRKLTGELNVRGAPADVKLSPDGSEFFVANMLLGGVHVINAATMTQTVFIPTGYGAHGLYPSRDATKLYVSNRYAGTVSVVNWTSHTVEQTWRTGGSPDMGGVTTDGKELWLSSRYSAQVLVIDTVTGEVTHRISVGRGPHGLCVFPQPGRFSMGHTGNYR